MQRRIITVASLISGLVAFYLHLWKMGKAGTLACDSGATGCEYVMRSWYGQFYGYDVALIGTVGYALIFVVALIGSMARFEDEKWPTIALMVLIFTGFLFTLRLKYGEFFVLHGFCKWCLVSAITITLCTVLVVFDWKRVRQGIGNRG